MGPRGGTMLAAFRDVRDEHPESVSRDVLAHVCEHRGELIGIDRACTETYTKDGQWQGSATGQGLPGRGAGLRA